MKAREPATRPRKSQGRLRSILERWASCRCPARKTSSRIPSGIVTRGSNVQPAAPPCSCPLWATAGDAAASSAASAASTVQPKHGGSTNAAIIGNRNRESKQLSHIRSRRLRRHGGNGLLRPSGFARTAAQKPRRRASPTAATTRSGPGASCRLIKRAVDRSDERTRRRGRRSRGPPTAGRLLRACHCVSSEQPRHPIDQQVDRQPGSQTKRQ